MNRIMCKSKIHRARITEANINYVGSVTIDRNLMDAADLLPYEQVHVLDITNGQRFITYVIEGQPGSGVICINGAAARLVATDDRVIIISYAEYQNDLLADFEPKVIFVNDANHIIDMNSMVENSVMHTAD